MASVVRTGVAGARKSTVTDSKGNVASITQSTTAPLSIDITVGTSTVTLSQESVRESLPLLTFFASTGTVH